MVLREKKKLDWWKKLSSHVPDINYNEMFAPIGKVDSIQLLLVIATT